MGDYLSDMAIQYPGFLVLSSNGWADFISTVRSLFLRNGFWQISSQRNVRASWGFHHWTYAQCLYDYIL